MKEAETCESCPYNCKTYCNKNMMDIVNNKPIGFICPLEIDIKKKVDTSILNKEFLIKNYIENGFTLAKIATITGKTDNQVLWAMMKHKIKRRSRKKLKNIQDLKTKNKKSKEQK